ncbi:MAG TPA: limonene-1,2-epoxide hydrolase family protein [Acidimicrobiales bacterium]|jgi:limonene-1,2-epoxide hydrolase
MSAGQAEQVVADFIAAIEKGDIDAALGYMATDAEYDNVPMSKAIGHDEIRATLAMFVGPDNPGQFEILRQAATGNIVMNERIDRLQMNGKAIEVQVAGVWQVDGDKITLWRDYFDMGQVTSQLS